MRPSRLLLLVLATATLASAQALLEYTAAAAGGTLGGIGGKPLSDAMDRIFKKTGDAAEKAADADRKKPEAAAKPAPKPTPGRAYGSDSAPASRSYGAARRRSASTTDPSSTLFSYAGVAPSPSRVRRSARSNATPEQVAAVSMGASSRDVLTQLGNPTARINIPEDGYLVEIWKYSNGDTDLGSLRIVNGSVSAVRSAIPQ